MPENFFLNRAPKTLNLGLSLESSSTECKLLLPMSINMHGQMGSGFSTKQNFGCENLTCHLHILKEHHSMKCSKVLYLVWAVTCSNIWYSRILCAVNCDIFNAREACPLQFLGLRAKATQT